MAQAVWSVGVMMGVSPMAFPVRRRYTADEATMYLDERPMVENYADRKIETANTQGVANPPASSTSFLFHLTSSILYAYICASPAAALWPPVGAGPITRTFKGSAIGG